MIMSLLRISLIVLAVIILINLLALPVWASQTGEMEIMVREDAQLLQQVGQSAAAGLGAAACVAVVFAIV